MNFLTVEQYQFVKKQAKKVLNTCVTSKDSKVVQAVQMLVSQEIAEKLNPISEEKQKILQPILTLQTKEQLESFINELKQYVIPFDIPTESEIKKLFLKDKKLKLPKLDQFNPKEVSYLSWFDSGTNRKYVVYREAGVLKGVRGVFSPSNIKGICTICNQHSKVGMIMVSKKGTALGTYTKRGNYICEDSAICNEALTDMNRFINFIDVMQQKY
ncbi:FusB/FusC family EF-G-binding protein [Ureibacillus sp. NPDC094379]